MYAISPLYFHSYLYCHRIKLVLSLFCIILKWFLSCFPYIHRRMNQVIINQRIKDTIGDWFLLGLSFIIVYAYIFKTWERSFLFRRKNFFEVGKISKSKKPLGNREIWVVSRLLTIKTRSSRNMNFGCENLRLYCQNYQ